MCVLKSFSCDERSENQTGFVWPLYDQQRGWQSHGNKQRKTTCSRNVGFLRGLFSCPDSHGDKSSSEVDLFMNGCVQTSAVWPLDTGLVRNAAWNSNKQKEKQHVFKKRANGACGLSTTSNQAQRNITLRLTVVCDCDCDCVWVCLCHVTVGCYEIPLIELAPVL